MNNSMMGVSSESDSNGEDAYEEPRLQGVELQTLHRQKNGSLIKRLVVSFSAVCMSGIALIDSV